MEFEQNTIQDYNQKAKNYFDSLTLIKAKDILDSSQINISFQKGNPESYFIISGLINDGE